MAFKTREQIEADAPERVARVLAQAEQDHARRVEVARNLVVGVLAEAPQERFAGGQRMLGFRVTEPGRDNPMSAVMFVAAHEGRDGFDRDGFDERVDAMRPGDRVSLAGSWSKRKWKDQAGADREAWEFKTQFFAKGDVSLAEMELEARARIGDARLATLPLGEEISARSRSVAEKEVDRDLDAVASPVVARDGSRPPASPTLSYVTGNIVDDRAQVLVNTVNSQLSEHGNPVMGKGVALEFKNRFPSIMKEYGAAISSGELRPGRAMLFDLPDGRKWAALATKDSFRDPSREEWVEAGLKELGDKVRAAGLTSVALPPPGCGNGGLDWKRVEPMVHGALHGLDVSMYARPSGAMEPAAERAAPSPAVGRDDVKSRQLAMFDAPGKGRAPQGGVEPQGEWTKDRLLAAIPTLMAKADGYAAYAGIGSRETPHDVCDDMTAMAARLEARGLTMRSGFAGGADTAFELGTTRDDLREVIAPWKGFGANPDNPHEKKRWDQIRRHEAMTGKPFAIAKPVLLQGELAARSAEMASRHHPGWDRLGNGPKQMHSRNMAQVLGPTLSVPARFELAYTVDGKASGGTGQAIRVAQSEGIPVLNLHDRDIRAAVMKELGIGLDRQRDLEASVGAAVAGTVKPAAPSQPGAKEFDLEPPAVRARGKHRVAYFCKVADPLGSLSNMANRHPIEIDGVSWPSTEAAYQAMRFPHRPDIQEAIRQEQNAFSAKTLAHKHKDETRKDWDDVKVQAMAYVITRKQDQSAVFRRDLESTMGMDVVELSTKDGFWGAQPRGADLVGRDVLGGLLTQLREGARMDEMPPGTTMPTPGLAAAAARSGELPEPAIRSSMYFAFDGQKRPEVKSDTTFQAILAGERTSTTRFPEWGSLDRYEELKPGQVVRFYEDRAMRGAKVDVVVTGVERVDLAKASPGRIAEWSKAEGWSEEAARGFGAKHREGVQIRYALPDSPDGRAALALARSPGRHAEASRREPDFARRQQADEVRSTIGRAAPSPAQMAGMSAKQKALSLF